ncbi:MAG: hypothetical protein R3C59_05600 [Planctomycetaceae bacterium]
MPGLVSDSECDRILLIDLDNCPQELTQAEAASQDYGITPFSAGHQ